MVTKKIKGEELNSTINALFCGTKKVTYVKMSLVPQIGSGTKRKTKKRKSKN